MSYNKEKEMYYDRELSPDFAQWLQTEGELKWLFELVKKRADLDFLIGKNKDKEWISVYRGLSRCVTINPKGEVDGAEAYKERQPSLYGNKLNFEKDLNELLSIIKNDSKFDRYYKNKKEGYYQNVFSRNHGILSDENTDFVIIDKEVVIGYRDTKTKEDILNPIQEKYKLMLEKISSIDAKRYGEYRNPKKRSIGNELDFLALDKNGNILLIEFKHGNNTNGIYLSPLQIGAYYDIFTKYYKENKPDFEETIFKMLKQKKEIGLINPDWQSPTSIKEIKPLLVISEYNYKSSAQDKYEEILNICRKDERFGNDFLQKIETYNFVNSKLDNWFL